MKWEALEVVGRRAGAASDYRFYCKVCDFPFMSRLELESREGRYIDIASLLFAFSSSRDLLLKIIKRKTS